MMTGAAGEARSHPQPGLSIDEASAHPRLGKVGADPMHGLPPTLGDQAPAHPRHHSTRRGGR